MRTIGNCRDLRVGRKSGWSRVTKRDSRYYAGPIVETKHEGAVVSSFAFLFIVKNSSRPPVTPLPLFGGAQGNQNRCSATSNMHHRAEAIFLMCINKGLKLTG